jgi:hypothetical protein
MDRSFTRLGIVNPFVAAADRWRSEHRHNPCPDDAPPARNEHPVPRLKHNFATPIYTQPKSDSLHVMFLSKKTSTPKRSIQRTQTPQQPRAAALRMSLHRHRLAAAD